MIVSAHLDTVFPEGTDVTVRVRGDTLFRLGVHVSWITARNRLA